MKAYWRPGERCFVWTNGRTEISEMEVFQAHKNGEYILSIFSDIQSQPPIIAKGSEMAEIPQELLSARNVPVHRISEAPR